MVSNKAAGEKVTEKKKFEEKVRINSWWPVWASFVEKYIFNSNET